MVQGKRSRGKINSEEGKETESERVSRETPWRTQGAASVEKALAV